MKLGTNAQAALDKVVEQFKAGEPTVICLVPTKRPLDSADLLAIFHLYEPGGGDPWAAR